MVVKMASRAALTLAVASTAIWSVSADDHVLNAQGSHNFIATANEGLHRYLQNGTVAEECAVAGSKFTCVVPTTYAYAPGTETDVVFALTCDLDANIGLSVAQSSNCVCDAEVNEFVNGTLANVQSCGCSACTNSTGGPEFSLDCSAVPDTAFSIVPGQDCRTIDCDGQCLGNATQSNNPAPTAASNATVAPSAANATLGPTSTGGAGAPIAPTSTPATNSTTAPSSASADNTTVAPSAAAVSSNKTTPTDANQTVVAVPSPAPTPAPRSTTCSVRGQSGYGFTITGNSVLCEGSDACSGGLVSSCETVTCGERDCTGTTIVNASKVICKGESACRTAVIGEADNPVDVVHCQGADWACYQAQVFANQTVICEDTSGACKVNENGVCGFANLSAPCLQCIGTNHGCGAAGSCKLNGQPCPEYRYGGETCEAACPEDQDCKMNDTVQACGDTRDGAASLSLMVVAALTALVSVVL